MKKALILSLLIHLTIIGLFQLLPIPTPPISVEVIRPSIPIEIIEYEKPKRLIIQKIKNQEIPDTADYLSSHNQKVKREQSGKKHLTLSDLAPRFDYSQKGTGPQQPTPSPPSGDKINDLPTGEETLVNSKEFIYYTFFMRIRRQLEGVWQPSVREKIYYLLKYKQINIYSDKTTKLLITLNNQGRLLKVQVLHDSGITDLDDEAINAFKKAEPFPNPPQGLIEADGTIKIKWDFIVER